LTASSTIDITAALSLRRVQRRGTVLRTFIHILNVAAILVMVSQVLEKPAFAQSGAMSMTQGMVNQALEILRNKQVPTVERQRQLRDLIEPRFDFTEMSRSALGYHWRTLSPDQRTNFTQEFTAFIEDAYLSKVQDYSGQQVVFVGEHPTEQGYAEVDTKIIQPGKNPISLTYQLEQKDGGWKIYDVAVDNISIIANYRNQFNRVINEQGFDKLLADLKAKQQELRSTLGSHQ
jgi:phospholipid transport system substrate-binding protein